MDESYIELIGSLGCIRGSRLKDGRKDLELFGVITNGRYWQFVRMDEAGMLFPSGKIDCMALKRQLLRIVNGLAFMLERAIWGMSAGGQNDGFILIGDEAHRK